MEQKVRCTAIIANELYRHLTGIDVGQVIPSPILDSHGGHVPKEGTSVRPARVGGNVNSIRFPDHHVEGGRCIDVAEGKSVFISKDVPETITLFGLVDVQTSKGCHSVNDFDLMRAGIVVVVVVVVVSFHLDAIIRVIIPSAKQLVSRRRLYQLCRHGAQDGGLEDALQVTDFHSGLDGE